MPQAGGYALIEMQRGPPCGGPLDTIKRQRLFPAQTKYPDTLRVCRRVDLGRAVFLPDIDAGRDTSRRLDLKMRDLQARQVACCATIAPAIIVAANDAEVCRDVQLLLGVVADDVIDRQVTIIGRRRECSRAALDVQVREPAGT